MTAIGDFYQAVLTAEEVLAVRGMAVIERDLLARGDLIRHSSGAIREMVVDLLGGA